MRSSSSPAPPEFRMGVPVIEFKEGRYVSFIAFVYGEQNRDWLAYGYRDPGGPWKVSYRFRYYHPEPTYAFDGKDKKSEYEAVALDEVNEETFAENSRAIGRELVAVGFNDSFDWIPVCSSDVKYITEILKKQPWCHWKEEEQAS